MSEPPPLVIDVVSTPTAVSALGTSGGAAPTPPWRKRAPLLFGGMLTLLTIGLGSLFVSWSAKGRTEVQVAAGWAAPTATQTKLAEIQAPGPKATASALATKAHQAQRPVEGQRAAVVPKRKIPKSEPAATPFDLKAPY
jgi:hypothetical protein